MGKFAVGADVQMEQRAGRRVIVPEGEHLVRVQACSSRLSSKGNPMLDTVLEVVDETAEGYTATVRVFYMIPMDEGDIRSLNRLRGILQAANPGLRGSDIELEFGEVMPQEWINEHVLGRCLAVRVYHREETYNGKSYIRANVARGEEQALNEAQSKLLAAQNGGEVPSGPAFDEDDIPF